MAFLGMLCVLLTGTLDKDLAAPIFVELATRITENGCVRVRKLGPLSRVCSINIET
jgi:hypothetical protein